MKVSEVLIIILVILLWAICFPLIIAGIPFAPHITFATIRALLAGTSLIALALLLGRPMPRGARTWATIGAVGLGATTLGFLGMFHAAEFVSPGIATVIANTQPLLAAVLAGIFLGERLDLGGKFGLALGFGGIVIIAAPRLFAAPAGNYAIGVAYILLAALGISVSNVLIKRIAGRVDALMAMGLQMLIGALPLAAIAWAFEEPQDIIWSTRFLFALVGLSLPGTALVYWLWFSVLERVPLNRAIAFSFLIPIFGLSMGVLFYGDTIGWTKAGGIASTLLGIVLVTRTIRVRAASAI
ncbi:MAG: DMT family transporter [Proteobacteria bacterium]|nr:DMT family transporter [Pseudomonadota bacterium]